MSSVRNTIETEGPTGPDGRIDAKLDGYLDTARACILDVGWKRTTLTDVARRAGVSRMTIYRAWPDMASLLGDLMTREWAAMGEAGDRGVEGDVIDRIIRTVRIARSNDLFSRIIEVDPELLLPYLLQRPGRSQEGVIALISEGIRIAQSAGTIREGEPLAMARALVLALHGFVLSMQTMVDDKVSEDDLEAEMRTLVEGFLR